MRATRRSPLVLPSLLSLAVLVLVAAHVRQSSAFAATVTVCPTGCDYTAIGAAVRAATSDTLINVGANTYAETSTPATTSLVTLTLSFQGAGATVQGPLWDVWLRVNSTVTIIGNLRLVGALEIASEGRLTQQGSLTVVPPSNFQCNATGWLSSRSFGVALSDGEWYQNGVVNVTVVSAHPAQGVISVPTSESGGKWEQKADAHNMEWKQTSGVARISARSTTGDSTAVYLESDSLWSQKSAAVLNSTALSTAVGVAVFGGEWRQSVQADATISGSKGSAGVKLSSATVGTSAVGSWSQEAPLSIAWASAAGHGLSCLGAGKWECLTNDLSRFIGDVYIAEEASGQCQWKAGYVPTLPVDFAVHCANSYDANAFYLPETLSPYVSASSGCGAFTTVPTVSFFDNSPATAARGVVYEFIVLKSMTRADVSFDYEVTLGNTSTQVSRNAIAQGESNTTISIQSTVDGSRSGALELLPALGSYALNRYRIELTLVTLSILNTPTTDERIALRLSFNVSAPVIGVNPAKGSSDEPPVGLNLAEIDEVSPEGVVVRTVTALKGEWSIGQVPDSVGAAQTYRFSADMIGNTTQFGLRWYLFDRETNVSVPSIVSDEPLIASPGYAKMTFLLTPSWPWLSSDNTLRLRMKVSPGFSSANVRRNTPQTGVTSYELAIRDAAGARASRTATVRLLGAALSQAAEGGALSRVAVDHYADQANSEVVLSFAHFSGALIFDPDFSVVLGSKKGESSSDDGLVVAVAVAVPTAVVLVVVVIVVALVAGFVSKRRYNARSRSQLSSINVDLDDLSRGEGEEGV